jgi:hypothetical protein
MIAGQNRNALAQLDIATGFATSWNPNVGYWFPGSAGLVKTMVLNGNRLYIGGKFYIVNGGIRRSNLASIDIFSGGPTNFIAHAGGPDATVSVNCIAVDPGKIYVGGNFLDLQGRANDNFGIFGTGVQQRSSTNELITTQPVLPTHGDKTVSLYPNPASDHVMLVITSPLSQKVKMTIIDINGRIVKEDICRLENGSNRVRISVTNLPAGIYTMILANGITNERLKFVKQ